MSQEEFELNGGYIATGKIKLEDHHIGPDVTREELIVRLLQLIEPVNAIEMREGLRETPKRVAKAFDTWFGGYKENAKDILKVFEDGSENYDEMVSVIDVPFYSKCEHHMADIFGVVTIAYIPFGNRIVGLSKLSRLIDMFARRLQVQERMTTDIADALFNELKPLGCGVKVQARHMCMESRGICQQGHYTQTLALRGCMKEDPERRKEFLALGADFNKK